MEQVVQRGEQPPQLQPDPPQPASPATWSPRALLVVVAMIAGFTVASLVVVELLGGTQRFRAWVEQAGGWAPVVYVLLKASTFVVAPLSGTSLKLAAGAVFGVWDGFLYTLLGSTLGGCLNFGIARRFGRPGVRWVAGRRGLARIDAATARLGGWRALVVGRVVFGPVYDFVSYAAGLSNLPFRHYFLVTLIGGVPPALFFAVLGDAAVTGGSALLWIAGACLGIGLLALVAWLVPRRGRVLAPSRADPDQGAP